MKAKIKALNKDYLVEFKNNDEFVSFLTEYNDKVKIIDVLNEEGLPELNKPVEVAKPSMSDGWKTLEKSAFVQKEKGVEKKGMTLGGKYAEFKYEPDKTLDASADDKVSEPKNDSPALKGDAPTASDVESTAKENEVEDAPKSEEPKEEKSEEKEESVEDDDKEEKKEEVNESVEDNSVSEDYKEGYIAGQESYDMGHYVPAEESDEESEEFQQGYDDGFEDAKAGIDKFSDDEEHHGPFDEEEYEGDDNEDLSETVDQILSEEEKEEVREYFKDIVENIEEYPNYEEMIQAMRSLDSNDAISHEQYNYCLENWNNWLSEFDPNVNKEREYIDEPENVKEPEEDGEYDEEIDEVLDVAGVRQNNKEVGIEENPYRTDGSLSGHIKAASWK